MKQIIDSTPLQTIDPYNATRNFCSSGGLSIIAYETKQKTGLGILNHVGNRWGFIYHSKLLRCEFSNLKFEASTAEAAIKKAANAGRTVLFFETYAEFVTHCAEYTKL